MKELKELLPMHILWLSLTKLVQEGTVQLRNQFAMTIISFKYHFLSTEQALHKDNSYTQFQSPKRVKF